MHDPSRLELVDSLRGFALMGLFLVHSVELFELYWADPQPHPVFSSTMALFAGKSFALFALCFGLSFFIIMDRARRRGVDFAGRFAWRLALLMLIGILHGLLYRGDILVVLALAGLTLIPADRIRSNRLLIAIALGLLLQPPLLVRMAAALDGTAWAAAPPLFFTDPTMAALTSGSLGEVVRANAVQGQLLKWSFYVETGRFVQVIGLFLAGLVLGRIGFFARPEAFVKPRRLALGIALLLALLLATVRPMLLDALPADGGGPAARRALEWLLSGWLALLVLTVQVVLFVELWQSFGRPLLRRLAPVGRMTLSLYVGQSVVFVPLFYGFGLDWHDDITQPQAIMLGLVAFAAQAALAAFWFTRFRYGPLEWLWRASTWLSLAVPMRLRPAAVAPVIG